MQNLAGQEKAHAGAKFCWRCAKVAFHGGVNSEVLYNI